MFLEQLVHGVVGGESALGGDESDLLDEVRVGQVDGQLVAGPVRDLHTHLRIAPRPIARLAEG